METTDMLNAFAKLVGMDLSCTIAQSIVISPVPSQSQNDPETAIDVSWVEVLPHSVTRMADGTELPLMYAGRVNQKARIQAITTRSTDLANPSVRHAD